MVLELAGNCFHVSVPIRHPVKIIVSGLNANPLQFYRHGILHPWKVFCCPCIWIMCPDCWLRYRRWQALLDNQEQLGYTLGWELVFPIVSWKECLRCSINGNQYNYQIDMVNTWVNVAATWMYLFWTVPSSKIFVYIWFSGQHFECWRNSDQRHNPIKYENFCIWRYIASNPSSSSPRNSRRTVQFFTE